MYQRAKCIIRSRRLQVEALEDRCLLSHCTVDRLTDNNPYPGGGEGSGMAGDLRWCVVESLFRADIIDFSVTGTIDLRGALPNLTKGVSIEGPGADLITVRRGTGGNYRIFTVVAGVTVGISGLTIANGNADDGGGGIYNSGTLTVSNSTVSGNTARFFGGIYNGGTLTVSNGTISGNTAPVLGGGIYNSGTLTVSNSTISGNRAGADRGGGIFNESTLTVSNSTMSGNTACSGAGIYNNNNGTLRVSSSTISGNTSGRKGDGHVYY